MSFDALAPHYRWMEWVLAGEKLQRCRVAFLPGVRQARHALLLGEGNGRFLTAFARANLSAHITVVDASEAMLQQAQSQVASSDRAGRPERIEFVRANVLDWTPPVKRFDLLVTNFFFDCFRADQLALLVPLLASAASESAQWLVSDFQVPPRGLARWRARWIVASMYGFFRVATRLPARTITPVDPLLSAEGFQLCERRVSEWGLLHTDLWRRPAA